MLGRAYRAKADIGRYRIIAIDAADSRMVAIATTATNTKIIGVTADADASTGENVTAHFAGVCRIEAGAAFKAGDLLTSDNAGRAIKASQANQRTIGIAIEDAEAPTGDEYANVEISIQISNY